ncbi:MAG: thiol reductant ABC exporter subunit CydC [Anaerolineaceae bacterium]|nr:MAG: thiol reductant ABC exporter subunit CydC [Anaerolineaceae bacterium]
MRRVFFRLLGLAKPFWKRMGLAVLLGFGTIASSVGLLATSAYIIAFAALQPSIAELQIAIVGVRFFGISRGILRYLERLVTHNAAFRLLARLRLWFYQKLEPLAPARLIHYQSGDLLSRIVADIETLEQFFVRVLAPPLVAVCIAILMWFLVGAFDPRLAAIIVAFLALAGVVTPVFVRRLGRGTGRQMVELRAALNTALVDGVQGCADLLAFTRAGRHQTHINSLSKQYFQLQERMSRVGGLSNALTGLLMNLSTITLLLVAIPLINAERIDEVYLALLVLAAIACFEAVIPLPSTFQFLENQLAAAQRLYEIVDARPSVIDPGETSPEPIDFSLSVRDLRFRYEMDEGPALDEVDFQLDQGSQLAVVGPSGAGKSTLVNLLLRFWDYDSGQIFLGGHELKAYHGEDLRRMIGVVSQDTHLFNDTIRGNLLLANPGADEHDLVQAASQAQIHEFVQSLPHGYDTWIGEAGVRLSGGERQRIAIARALLKNTPILILDEPTANLDALTEREVIKTLYGLMEGRTTLIITHRLVGLENVGQILVMREGRIIERGRHDELIQAEGFYHRMWRLQTQSDALDILHEGDASDEGFELGSKR